MKRIIVIGTFLFLGFVLSIYLRFIIKDESKSFFDSFKVNFKGTVVGITRDEAFHYIEPVLSLDYVCGVDLKDSLKYSPFFKLRNDNMAELKLDIVYKYENNGAKFIQVGDYIQYDSKTNIFSCRRHQFGDTIFWKPQYNIIGFMLSD